MVVDERVTHAFLCPGLGPCRTHSHTSVVLIFGHEARATSKGVRLNALLESRGFQSVAATDFQAPGVVVSYTQDADIHNSKKFLAMGLQTAAGVPLQCDEPKDFMTFRIGLFGLEKLHDPARSTAHLAKALDEMGYTATRQAEPALA